jgi:sulfur-carrier protein adenylyltransferase/sulfurtransferase
MTQSQTRPGKTFQQLVQDALAEVKEITQDELKGLLKEHKAMALIDVREQNEVLNGAIEGSVNIPRGILELQIDAVVPNPEQFVVLYCAGGARSALAAQTLHTMGYHHVVSLRGGFRDWLSD